MTSPERMYALFEAVRYVVRAGIQGAFVECGVWRGGSSMCAALTLASCGDTDRELWLYDTFAGMSAPSEHENAKAHAKWRRSQRDAYNEWCYAPLEAVRDSMAKTAYPSSRIRYVKGMVEETLPATVPSLIALLRLDTDFFESTLHELKHLWPLLAPGGVLLIDDYGHYAGARKAVDEFFADRPVLLSRIDYTGRIAIKPTQ